MHTCHAFVTSCALPHHVLMSTMSRCLLPCLFLSRSFLSGCIVLCHPVCHPVCLPMLSFLPFSLLISQLCSCPSLFLHSVTSLFLLHPTSPSPSILLLRSHPVFPCHFVNFVHLIPCIPCIPYIPYISYFPSISVYIHCFSFFPIFSPNSPQIPFYSFPSLFVSSCSYIHDSCMTHGITAQHSTSLMSPALSVHHPSSSCHPAHSFHHPASIIVN